MKIYIKPHDDGFTLLEVLVALVILGLALAMLTNAISDSLYRSERIDTEDRATTLADTILARLGRDIPLNISVTQGEKDNLNWQLIVTPYTATAIPLDQINLTIRTPTGRLIGRWQTLRVAIRNISE